MAQKPKTKWSVVVSGHEYSEHTEVINGKTVRFPKLKSKFYNSKKTIMVENEPIEEEEE